MAKHSNGVTNGKAKTNGHAATNSHSHPDHYVHIQPKGSWELPRKAFHYSIGKRYDEHTPCPTSSNI